LHEPKPKLAKLKARFLSPFFLPRSPHSSQWTDVHLHIPPSTFSGFLFRALTYIMNRLNVKGDYYPCEIGTGLLAKISNTTTEWHVAKKQETIPGFKPPYLELHFNAVSLGAYPLRVLRGETPEAYMVDKYWNTIKYIDTVIKGAEGVPYDMVLSIKTWHYAVMDGAKLDKGRIDLYEPTRITHVVIPEDMDGFVLVYDLLGEELLRRLSRGWFIMKTRMKNLLALRVEKVLEPASRVDAEGLVFLPTPRKPASFSLMFSSNILDIDMVKESRRDRSVIGTYLFIPVSVDDTNSFMFFGDERELYAVDKSWLQYISVSRS